MLRLNREDSCFHIRSCLDIEVHRRRCEAGFTDRPCARSRQGCRGSIHRVQRICHGPAVAAIPEPGSLALLGLGLADLAAARGRRRVRHA
ncbi:PEP-CTERM sorting domain-containing protein [Massilia sp. CCM 8695]|uniref:PEP-CTERM sorting domain-containing protein n=1 Tax=Massilia frigida TaxID=2609281 RepID=A0ABX0NE26_9BURK|nr:PEP-CTERM sorting domain-containing protein [Massilia frigida]